MAKRPFSTLEIQSRLLSRIEVDADTGCWIWVGSRDQNGYGKWGLHYPSGPTTYAHRLSYEVFVGPIPSETPCLDHLCCNKSCIRPEHLEAVTKGENTTRANNDRRERKHG